jgi:hypothetical protein
VVIPPKSRPMKLRIFFSSPLGRIVGLSDKCLEHIDALFLSIVSGIDMRDTVEHLDAFPDKGLTKRGKFSKNGNFVDVYK